MHNLRSRAHTLPTKFATTAVETNQLTDAESCATQFAVNFARVVTATTVRCVVFYHSKVRYTVLIMCPTRSLRSHPQPLPTKFAAAFVETNQLTDAESRSTQFVANFVRLITLMPRS